MPTLTVIKHFDVIKNIAAGFFPRSVDLFLYPFAFQQLEKAFCNRIIVTVTATAHTPLQAV
ncbi:hypothetical protein UUU_33500 [Klebsiella pneumoniae subsp. pneumoniae DSM 30104 = JCM 1662 = NBRC 14940]|nr:hypothetical protein UUU_33500 [Klebsiella pneumoniae subsp. pneumoniae DSM 30104 = JCM 1662 = NBRC 14940]